jgi:hypothetical protein
MDVSERPRNLQDLLDQNAELQAKQARLEYDRSLGKQERRYQVREVLESQLAVAKAVQRSYPSYKPTGVADTIQSLESTIGSITRGLEYSLFGDPRSGIKRVHRLGEPMV